jgi:hypothetical protein
LEAWRRNQVNQVESEQFFVHQRLFTALTTQAAEHDKCDRLLTALRSSAYTQHIAADDPAREAKLGYSIHQAPQPLDGPDLTSLSQAAEENDRRAAAWEAEKAAAREHGGRLEDPMARVWKGQPARRREVPYGAEAVESPTGGMVPVAAE